MPRNVTDMTGPEHWAAANRLLDPQAHGSAEQLARAAVHATLALTAATIAVARDPYDPDWDCVVRPARNRKEP